MNHNNVINPSCTVNILHTERHGVPLSCKECKMECKYKKEVNKDGMAQ